MLQQYRVVQCLSLIDVLVLQAMRFFWTQSGLHVVALFLGVHGFNDATCSDCPCFPTSWRKVRVSFRWGIGR